MLFHSVTEEDVERLNCLVKSCPYCVRNSLLEDQNHLIVSKMKLLTNTPFVHLNSISLGDTLLLYFPVRVINCCYFICHCIHEEVNVIVQSCTQIIRPLTRFYSYDYDLRKTNYIFT